MYTTTLQISPTHPKKAVLNHDSMVNLEITKFSRRVRVGSRRVDELPKVDEEEMWKAAAAECDSVFSSLCSAHMELLELPREKMLTRAQEFQEKGYRKQAVSKKSNFVRLV